MNFGTGMDAKSRREHYFSQIDHAVLSALPDTRRQGVAIADLLRLGFKRGSIRASLKRMLDSKIIQRVWDGNGRYGRYLYYSE